jgi:hypothetical protein
MQPLQVRMSAMEVAAIRAALMVGSATVVELARRTALTSQAIVRMPYDRIRRQNRRARQPTGTAGHSLASRLGADDVLLIRESLATGTAVPDELARQYRVTPRTIRQIATHDTWKHVRGPKLTPNWGPRTNTGYWGVTANGAGNRFSVSLYHDGRKYAFGWYKDVVEAARAYDAKARELGLPPQRLNFPDVD